MNIRYIIYCFIWVLGIEYVNAQVPEPDFDWAEKIGNSGQTGVGFTAFDNNGNLYVAGSFANTSLTANGITITASSGVGFFLKYDENGNKEWIKKIPLSMLAYYPNLKKIVATTEGAYMLAFYNVGSYYQMDFDGIQMPPTAVQGIQGGANALIKMDSNGVIEWIKAIDRYGHIGVSNFLSDITFCYGLHFDENKNIHAVGAFKTKVKFDDTLILTNPDSTQIDAFHAVYDTLGNLLSAVRFGENGGVHSGGVHFFAMDKQNNTYRYVNDENTLIKYNASGDALWVKELSVSGGTLFIKAMEVDPWGNIFFAGGMYGGAVTLEGSIIQPVSSSDRNDAVLFKLNADDGGLAWIRQYNYGFCDYHEVMDIDDIGNIYVGGQYYYCSGGASGLPAVLFAKYDNNGSQLWEKVINGWQSIYNITQTHNGGNVIIGGIFRESINFGNGNILTDNTTTGGNPNPRAFIAKYGLCNNMPQPQISAANTGFCQGDSVQLSVAVPTAGYSYVWSTAATDTATSIYVKESGNYSVFAVDANGCYAQSQEIYIEEYPETTATDVITACDSFTWIDGNTYTSSNSAATHTLTSTTGCDSLVMLSLTVNYSNTVIDEITACGSYTWINGITYSGSNSVATHILTNTTGCDSLVMLDLTINSVDTSVTQSGATLTANTSEAAYQWIDCGNNTPTGETGQTFTPAQDGYYAVILTSVEGCIDTSACYAISTVGIGNNPASNDRITVSFNPTNGIVYFSTPVNIQLTNVLGEIITGKKNINSLDLSKQPAGIYFISFFDPNGNIIQYSKIIKE